MTRPVPSRLRPSFRSGFTLLEFMFVSAMMSLLVVLFSAAWSGVGRPSADAVARCRMAHEASLAAQCLARDFSGSLAEETTGGRQVGRLVGREVIEGSELRLCFDGGSCNGTADWDAPDTVIVYRVLNGQFIRTNVNTGTVFTVAGNVNQMQATALPDGIRVDLTFAFRRETRTYTMIAREP